MLTPTAPTEAGPAPLDRSCRSPPGAGAPSTDANHASADESLEPPTEQGEDLGRGFCRLPETVSEAMLTQGGRPHLLESVWRDEKQAPRCEDAVRTGSASRQGPASLLWEGLRAPPTPRSARLRPHHRPHHRHPRTPQGGLRSSQHTPVGTKVPEWARLSAEKPARHRAGLPHLFRLLFAEQTTAVVLREPKAEKGKERSPQEN